MASEDLVVRQFAFDSVFMQSPYLAVTSFDDTAYPRFPRALIDRDLDELFTPAEEEISFVIQTTGDDHPKLRLSFMLLLKCMQHLNYLPQIEDIPTRIVNHVRLSLGMDDTVQPGYPTDRTKYRHHKAIRQYLGIQAYDHPSAAPLLREVLRQAAQLINNPADLINVAIEELLRHRYELPAFSTLDRVMGTIREEVHSQMFHQITARLSEDEKKRLDEMLVSESPALLSELFRVKQPAGRASVSEMRRYALMVCLLHDAQIRALDDLVEMFLQRLNLIHKRGKQVLEEIHRKQQEMTEDLVNLLYGVAYRAAEIGDDAQLGRSVRDLLTRSGGLEAILENCEAVAAHSGNNYLPLLYRIYSPFRSLLFGLMRLVQPQTTSGDQSLVIALEFVLVRQFLTREWWEGILD